MSNEIILRNYSEYKKYTIWSGSDYRIVDKEAVDRQEQGISGFAENEALVGVFVKKDDAFFLIDNKEYKICKSNFECSNIYIDKKTRKFQFINQNDLICEIIYEPYIDPGMVMYDSDPEEFDFLLFISNNILQSKEALANFVVARNK
ncbi:hypothetical protein BBD42_03875 [Paenibacillus sp. BIHB 4019]|uniref:Uncharacterized protein n=1 Tax=Paenibacillus sp. BIHB 4019 TaxID=1870819 RepID=A0A1B2DDC8_9BACL|nr:hypothetical protein [Paenibacillus sp. BIHB 4019]ANY65696.1 hypothetical protein BBD42_03875 [Paenibacillus sp. BIHB 4019]